MEITDDVDLLLTHHYQKDEVGGRRAVTKGADYNVMNTVNTKMVPRY